MVVSIIVPTYNEEKFIKDCIESIFDQDYKDFEVLVVDGMSKDGTREILQNYEVKVLDNPKRIKPCALNIGIKHAHGEIIMVMDAHADYSKDYVSKCVESLTKYKADNVGGTVKTSPAKDSIIAKAIAISLSHMFGAGSAFRKGVSKPQIVDTVFGGCFKKEVFEKIGLFNENLIRSQDMEFNLRLQKAGGKILLVPNIVSYYYSKSNLKDFFFHNIKDGVWAIYPLKSGVTLKLRHYIPLIFLLTLPISIWVYLPVSLFFSCIVALQKRNWKYLYALPPAFVVRHIGYGLGSLWGLLKLISKNNKMIKSPQNELVKRVRKFWYSNTEGDFDLNGEKISRKDIFTYGGPNPKFTCPICQQCEWLSRIKQRHLFKVHLCPQAYECQTMCSHQGNDLWTHHHQNFDFMFGCDSTLPAPKCLYLNDVPTKNYKRFTTPRCDLGERIFKRQWAYSCQLDMVQKIVDINWSDYDVLFVDITGCRQTFPRPNIPIILYGHDYWGYNRNEFQKIIDWLQPDVFMTSYPSQWKEKFTFPSSTRIVFYPLIASDFFNRPNLTNKEIDLLVIGATSSSIYNSRVSLNQQLSKLKDYKIEFSHATGCVGDKWEKETYHIENNKPVRYLNKWSEYLSTARYVVFGRMQYPILAWKYCEALGSGAIPIFPEVPDLERLGVKPFVHYIPLSEIEGDNEKLSSYLNNYEKHKHIAKNAVKWYNKNANRMLFEDFEDNIGKLTYFKYLKRKL